MVCCLTAVLRILSLVLMLVLVPALGQAQQSNPGAPVTETGSTGLAAQVCLVAAGSGQQTLTIPNPGPGLSVYLDMIEMQIEATGTVLAGNPVPFTTTNIAGTPSFSACQNALTQGQLCGPGILMLGLPLKALTATSPTIVGPAAITNASQRIAACWHVAP